MLRSEKGFSLLNIIFSIAVIVATIAATVPLYTACARMQRSATERIQVLWYLHGLMGQSRNQPFTTENQEFRLDETLGLTGQATVIESRMPDSRLVKVTVKASWTSLQGRELSETLSETMIKGSLQ
mgnify:FL=1